jgi:hypothetical protein
MYNEIDKAVREYRMKNQYPNKIIIGINALNELSEEMKSKFAMGLKVNLQGEYVSLFGMTIEKDYVNKDKIQFGYIITIQ